MLEYLLRLTLVLAQLSKSGWGWRFEMSGCGGLLSDTKGGPYRTLGEYDPVTWSVVEVWR